MAAAARTPFESARRVFVIESVEAMNDQSANRMLKTLEEPPDFVHLLLLSDRLDDVLPTIASRCQLVRFDPLGADRIAATLTGVEEQRARACARLALGDAGLAAWLAGEEGDGLRRAAEAFVRGAISGDSASRAWLGADRAGGGGGSRCLRGRSRRLPSRTSSCSPPGSANVPNANCWSPAAAASAAPGPACSTSRCGWRSCGCGT